MPHRTASSSLQVTSTATQAHPEFLSRPNRAHPLFAGLVGAALDRQRAQRLVEVERTTRPESQTAAVG